MLSWLAKRMISRNMAKLREGDPGPTLLLDAKDIRFRFPGTSSWATELESKEELEAWPSGERIYENRYVIWGRLSWGLLREYEVYEDTQRTEALDEHLAAAGKL